MKRPYDIYSADSIIQYAKLLKDHSLNEVCERLDEIDYGGKGKFGQALEKGYFKYTPNSDSDADFKEAGLELKSSSLKELKNGSLSAKERISLNSINFFDMAEEKFGKSLFWRKNKYILFVFYLYVKEIDDLDRIIKLVDDWKFPEEDLKIIRNDWHLIRQKIRDGKAHELSEGDTLYLAANTKGNKGDKPQAQPYSDELAPKRGLSLKNGYAKYIVSILGEKEPGNYGKIVRYKPRKKRFDLEKYVIEQFKPYYGMEFKEIVKKLGIDVNMKAKNAYASTTKYILGENKFSKFLEFEKADITTRTIRIQENNTPKESVSFPAFQFMDIVDQDWEHSNFKQQFEKKFFFVFYRMLDDELILHRVRFWNMAHVDILNTKMVFDKLQTLLIEGRIVKEIKIDKNGKRKRMNYFPKQSDSKICHVRPHGEDSNDTFSLPTPDKLTGVHEYTKQCFWLNSGYIQKIYLNKI